jgi:DNA repair protein RecO (recombination protein O)
MEWSAEAIVLSLRKHGENAVIAGLFTREHGRHAGYLRARPAKGGGWPLVGNRVRATWRARLSEHLGHLTAEPLGDRVAEILDDPLRLAALRSLAALVELSLPEREAHPALFDATDVVIEALAQDVPDWPQAYIRWELGLLAELGYGLDLTHCAATGATADLTHVSPRSGRAVSAAAARPYLDRLLRLPAFLAGGRGGPAANDLAEDLKAGLTLTGFFLERRVLLPLGQRLPPDRERLAERLARAAPNG